MPEMPKFKMPEWAKKKVGPFPVWAYGAVGGGLLLALYLKGHPFNAGSAGTATIGGPGSSAGLGAGNLPIGSRPPSPLETSPPGSPASPGSVSHTMFTPSHFTPSSFVSSFRNPGAQGPGVPVTPVAQLPAGLINTTIAQLGPGIGAFARSENLPLGTVGPVQQGGNWDFMGYPAYETGMEMPVGIGSAFGSAMGSFMRSESGAYTGPGSSTNGLGVGDYNAPISYAVQAPAYVPNPGTDIPGYSPSGGYNGPSGSADTISAPPPSATSGIPDTTSGFVPDASGSTAPAPTDTSAPVAVGSSGNFVA